MGAGLAIAGLAVVQRPVAAPSPTPEPARPDPLAGLSQAPAAFEGPVIVHVRDLAQAEISVLVGTREVVYRDPALVSRLLRGAHEAAAAEA
jgi:hypothetical protein